MAYNLQPLITILEQILDPQQKRGIFDHNKPQLESLLEKAVSLQQIFEKISVTTKTESLESQIRNAAHKAEDIIESNMADQMRSKLGLTQVSQELDSVMKFIEGKTASSSSCGASSSHDVKQATQEVESLELVKGMKKDLVGVDADLMQLKRQLTNIIESYIIDRTFPTLGGLAFKFSTEDLQQVMKQLDSAKEQVVKLMEEKAMSKGTSSLSCASFSQEVEALELVEGKKMAVSSKKDLVGVDEDLLQLKERLTNIQGKKLEIIPIVGMGGIGKSAIALNLYESSLILSHFDYRGWAAISQVYNMRSILLNLLRDPNGKIRSELIGLEESKLKDLLHKNLFGRRYLIVLDDTWSTSFWDEISIYFPDNNNGSRILITTRELDVAKYANSSMQHHVELLDEYESWDLLRQIVFGEEDFPHELQEIGTKIVADCCGLPLAIHVIGGLLSKVERSKDVWQHILTDVKAALVKSDKQFSNILSLSYNHLPIHLKPCFLYMGAFPEDFEIKGSRLVSLWIAEGFVKSNGDKSLEEEAKGYLKALVERNLLLVQRKKYNGKPRRYAIHDLLRDLCIGKANEEKFMRIKNSADVRFSNERRVCVHSEMEDVCASPQLMSLARSFICTQKKKILLPMLPVLRLLRVLDVLEMEFEEFPREILQLVNLRYLAFSCDSGAPIGISRLWKLQTLISEAIITLTSEIWEMSELRHLKTFVVLELEEGYEIKSVNKKLQTIKYIGITRASIRSGFFESIPNIVKLGIAYMDPPCIEVDLSHLHKLETLSCYSELDKDGSLFLPKLRLPCNLRKLTLIGCVIYGSFLTSLCALPSLEALKILECVFESEVVGEDEEEWEATEGDVFHSLQFLRLGSLNIVRWRADETNFPTLQQLCLYECHNLEEIPSAFGDIPTLEEITISECSASVVASAQEIERVQQDEYDNYDLKLIIY